MALASGTNLGPYEVTGALVAGGMGEVYRAHDSRLKRDVAYTSFHTLSGSGAELLESMILRRSGDEWLIDRFLSLPLPRDEP